MPGRRLLTLGVILAVLGIPAVTLRALCVGRSCASDRTGASNAPFCSLPEQTRAAISRGFYDGRSGDVLAVTGSTAVESDGVGWPSIDSGPPAVPIVFWGAGITQGVELSERPGLEDIAPTIARVLDYARPHPEVRAGKPVADAVSGPTEVRLILEVVWQGIGTHELDEGEDSWPNLARLIETGAGTIAGEIGALPTDPAAALATIGTGGLPAQHGMTGSVVRNDDGRPVRPWGKHTPSSVIATLPDHLEEGFRQKPVIALVGTNISARGVIGGTWGIEDRDLVTILPRAAAVERQTAAAMRSLRAGALGRDEVPDVLGVVLTGDLDELDRYLPRLIAAAEEASDDRLLVVVTGTGTTDVGRRPTMSDIELVAAVESEIGGSPGLIEAVTPGALFLDAGELRRRGVYDDVVLKPLNDLRSPSGERVFADVFPAAAVTFGRFC